MKVSDLGALVGRRSLPVPRWLLYALVWACWHLRVLVEAPPGFIDYSAYPWVLDTTRAKELLGWRPRYSTYETAKIMFASHAGYRLVGKD